MAATLLLSQLIGDAAARFRCMPTPRRHSADELAAPMVVGCMLIALRHCLSKLVLTEALGPSRSDGSASCSAWVNGLSSSPLDRDSGRPGLAGADGEAGARQEGLASCRPTKHAALHVVPTLTRLSQAQPRLVVAISWEQEQAQTC
jgi:hypothetical protein